MSHHFSRRRFMQGVGGVVVGFSLPISGRYSLAAPEQPTDPKWSADEQRELTPALNGWLRVEEDGTVTYFTGRVELGNGILTALTQVVAEELSTPFDSINVISGDTDVVPNQGITSATTTIGAAAVVLRQAAATARQAILDMAAESSGTDIEQLDVTEGKVVSDDGQEWSFSEIVNGRQFERDVDMDATTRDPEQYSIVGESIPRIDIPPKLTAAPDAFVENARLENMAHARILRAPAYGARLTSWDESVQDMDGVVAVIPFEHPGNEALGRVDRLETMPGDFIAVVADQENQAISAVEALRDSAEWDAGEELPTTHEELYDWVIENGEPIELVPNGDVSTRRETFDEIFGRYQTRREDASQVVSQTYRGPYLSYGPISPAFALADVTEDSARVWSATQWPFGSRWMVAQALGFDDSTQVQIIGGSSSGLYGRRDDYDQEVDVEAALISREVGRPVRLQWSRSDEFVWGQYRPPQIVELEASIDADDRIDGLYGRVHTAVRGVHPAPGIAAMALQDTPYVVADLPIEAFDAGPILRTGYMRNVFSGYNIFALESLVDEVAHMVGKDPVEYRLSLLEDERAIEVIETVTSKAGWNPSGGSGGSGMGISFALYTAESGPSSAYMAYTAEVDVDESSGEVQVRKFNCAIDPGLVVNPDGVINQVEGGVIQAMSWAMKEQVTFDRSIVTSHDWETYPILRFSEVPEIDVTVIDRKDQPSKGIGEPVTVPVASAIANAIYDAVGARVRTLPITADRVLEAMQTPPSTPVPSTPAATPVATPMG